MAIDWKNIMSTHTNQDTDLKSLINTAKRAVEFYETVKNSPASGTGAARDAAEWNADIVRRLAELPIGDQSQSEDHIG